MMSQDYWITPTEFFEDCKPGQFVYGLNNEDSIKGFIYMIDNETKKIRIVLWDPIELSNIPLPTFSVNEELTLKEITDMLNDSLKGNPELKEEWRKLLTEINNL